MKQETRSPSTLAALAIFLIFAVGILSVLLGGSQAYRRITQRDQLAYNSRTGVQYLATRLRQAPSPQSIRITTFGDGAALGIIQVVDGADYVTLLYCYDGWLMELFALDNGGFSPEDGEQILPAEALALSMDNGLLTAELLCDDGTARRVSVQIRGYQEVQP